MKVVCLGGGPAGLYFAISMKLRDPTHHVVVIERNPIDNTFGWGVVLSDDALSRMQLNDPESTDAIRKSFAYWDDIAVVRNGERTVSGGHGFAGIGRKAMLAILTDRAKQLGVELKFETEVRSANDYRKDFDLVIGCDGINSIVRREYADAFKPDIDTRLCKFVWLGTHQKFNDAFVFIFEKTEHGWMWAHVYQFDQNTATFIVECLPETWMLWGFDKMSKEDTIATCERIFAKHLGGHSLMSNAAHLRGSAVWMQFPRVICTNWYHENVVLMGDAAATGHFSIGSGSRLAFDSAIALAEYLHSEPTLQQAFQRYQDERRLEVLRLQSAARNSLEWFEEIDRYLDLDMPQFSYSLLTRSQRISHENLRLRDKEWLEDTECWFQNKAGASDDAPVRPPMFAPFRLRGMQLKNRIVVSPMAQYKAIGGVPNDWHLVHYGERAKGGAALIFTEMTCVSANGRITEGCPGLYANEHESAWRRIIDFMHRETDAKICCQIGHSGRKGSTQLGWEEMDAPLQKGNWPIISASAVPWSSRNATPKEMTRADMIQVREEFVSSTQMAQRAGFDMIELHAAHGYLLSSFISPKSNLRHDDFGGSLQNRMRYPLEVFAAMRASWPPEKPMSVRISATDWVGSDGITPEDAVEIARMFSDAGADVIDVSAGQTSTDARPAYGRMFQTPFSDRIRNEAHVATMAVGNIYEPDHANSILMAGRADLVCIGRPHLADPYWTLHAASRLGDRNETWPLPYLAGRDQVWRLADRPEPAIEKGLIMSRVRHAIVTGGGSGVGAEIARTLAAAGLKVTITGRHEMPLRKLADASPGITAMTTDVTDFDAAHRLVAMATEFNGPPDVVVANAGASASKPFSSMTSADLAEMLAANLSSTFNIWHAALPGMRDAGWGRLIAIASTAGLKGYSYVSGYVAAKHAVVGLTRALGQELAQTGVTVNAICPGFTQTPMLERSIDTIVAKTGRSREDAKAALVAGNPQRRFITPGEIASLALWLSSDAAASVNGQAIAISGGEV